jgi:hypothetical protein
MKIKQIMNKAKNCLQATAITLLLIIGLGFSGNIYAADSDSFSNTDSTLNNGAVVQAGSDSFQMDGIVTWYSDGESDSYQVSLQPDEQEESSSSSSQQSQSSRSTASQAGTAGGGNRGPTLQFFGTRAAAPVQAVIQKVKVLRPAAVASPAASKPAINTSVPIRAPAQNYSEKFLQKTIIRPFSPRAKRIQMQPSTAQKDKKGLRTELSDPCQVARSMPVSWLFVTGGLTIALGHAHGKKGGKGKRGKSRAILSRSFISIGVLCILAGAMSLTDSIVVPAHAEETTAQYRIYNGYLRNGQGQAVITAHSVRFSYWRTSDAQPSDLNPNGTVNQNAPNFVGWTEIHNVTPNASGNFNVKLGSIQPLNLFETLTPDEARSLYLQVEVKPAAAPFTAFEILDVDRNSNIVDRSPVLPVPFARNADLLDLHDAGTGSGSIPVLQSGGLLPKSMIPGGTNLNTFILDADNTATDTITLQFGSTLAKKLTYDIPANRFAFNADVRVEGDLTVTGLINGIDVTNLSSAVNTHLKVSSGAGLTINIAGGSYRTNGSIVNYTGDSGLGLANNANNYVFFGSGGLNVRTLAFPTDESFIPLAIVTTSGGAVTGVADKRVLQSDDREQNVQRVLQPSFDNVSFQADGSTNVGQLVAGHDLVSTRNYYNWSSTRGALQDYTIILRITLPEDFVRWQDVPVTVFYRSATANAADNQMDIEMLDTAGTFVSPSGIASDLTSTGWTSTALSFNGNPTWTAGQSMIMKFTMAAKNPSFMQLGEVQLRYVTLQGN